MEQMMKCPLCGTENKRTYYSEDVGLVEDHYACKHCGYTEEMAYSPKYIGIDTSIADDGVWPSPKRMWKLAQAEKDGKLAELPFVAMVEQSLQDGQMKPERDQRFNGRYAVVYSDPKKWRSPLIDICGTHYNRQQAEKRLQDLTHEEAKAALSKANTILCKHGIGRHTNELGEDEVYCELTGRWMNVALGDCLGNCESEAALEGGKDHA